MLKSYRYHTNVTFDAIFHQMDEDILLQHILNCRKQHGSNFLNNKNVNKEAPELLIGLDKISGKHVCLTIDSHRHTRKAVGLKIFRL